MGKGLFEGLERIIFRVYLEEFLFFLVREGSCREYLEGICFKAGIKLVLNIFLVLLIKV